MATKKHGRSKGKPTDQRYKAEQRWIRNKERRIAREQRRRKRIAAKKLRRSRAA